MLERVREEALQLLEEVDRQPRTLRVRAGDVTVDVEWEPEQSAASPPGHPAGPGPAPGEQPPEDQPEPDQEFAYLVAPTVGVFYRAPEPDAEPFVAEGDTVSPGQQVAIVEAMKLMVPVEADRAGRVERVLKGNGDPVEYGERLFAIEPGEAA